MQQPKRILIVDDEEVNRDLLEGLVETFGHESLLARDGNEALSLLHQGVDVVLLDAMMPGMSGFEVARHIRADEEVGQIPIIMVTALTSKEDRLRAVEAGANDFITKPIDRTELRVRLASLLKMKEAQDAIRRHEAELRQKNQQLEADLELAREIQSAFVPRQYPSFPPGVPESESALRFAHRWLPTTALGGDFFHVLALSDTRASLFICDVMGHGVRSALITAMMRALVGEYAPLADDPAQFLREINAHLMGILKPVRTPLFASGFYLVVDTATGEAHYANAGHPGPLWLKAATQSVQHLNDSSSAGPAMGIFEDAEYTTSCCQLEAGDRLLLFTDGLFEVSGPLGEYGEDRLRATVQAHINLPTEDLFDEILSEIKHFAGSDEFEDDVCLVGLDMVRLVDANFAQNDFTQFARDQVL